MKSSSATSQERVHKTMRLAPATITQIEKAAENFGLNFTRTVEQLVQWGFIHANDYSVEVDVEIQRLVVEQAVGRALNRYLKVLSQTTIAANEAKEMAQQVFFAQLCLLSNDLYDAEDVDEALTLHSWKPLHEKLHETYEQRCERGRQRANEALSKTLQLDDETWAEVAKWGKTKTVEKDDVTSRLIAEAVEAKLNRYLELLTQTVIAATEAKEMAQQIFFVQLRQLADNLNDPAEVRPALALNSRDPLHNALYELYRQRQARGRNRAVRELKSAIDVDAWRRMIARMEGTDA